MNPLARSRQQKVWRTDHIHVIKRKSKTVSYAEALTPESPVRHYAIGIPSVLLARKLQYTIEDDPIMRLHRSAAKQDITHDVNSGLAAMGIPSVNEPIMIDTRAQLRISKTTTELHPLEASTFHLSHVPIDEFLCYPFERNIGIIIPYEVYEETPDQVTLMVTVLENATSVRDFRATLRIEEP